MTWFAQQYILHVRPVDSALQLENLNVFVLVKYNKFIDEKYTICRDRLGSMKNKMHIKFCFLNFFFTNIQGV